MENIQKIISPVSIAIILASGLVSFVGYKYVEALDKQNSQSSYNSSYDTLSVKGRAEKIVKLDTIWATFQVPSVNLQGDNLTAENRALYKKKMTEITDKIRSLGVNEKDLVMEIIDDTDYTADATEIMPVSTKDKDLKAKVVTESVSAYDEVLDPYYDSTVPYNTDTTKDKKVFSVTFGAPIGKVTEEQLNAITKDLGAKKVNIYNSLTRKAYNDLSDELNELAVRDAFKKADAKADAFRKDAVSHNNSYYDPEMSSSMIDDATDKYFVETTYNFKLE